MAPLAQMPREGSQRLAGGNREHHRIAFDQVLEIGQGIGHRLRLHRQH
jgi:hypothetical protein